MELVLGAFCVLIPLGFVLVVAVAVLGARRARERHLSLASYAEKRQWRFSPSGTGLERRFSGDPFGRGQARRAGNVVEGWYAGRAFVAFDYSYRTSSGDDESTHHFSVVSMHLGGLAQPVPLLQVAPQGALGRFFGSLLGTDHLLGDPVFDAAFRVRTDSPELARDVLHLDLRMMLAAYQDRAWRLQGDSLLMFRRGQHAPDEIDAVLSSMRAILERVPPHVWARLGADPTG